MQNKILITGTDTEVGKTFFTCAMIRALQNNHQSVMAIKPIASGAEIIDGKLKNDDALNIQKTLNYKNNTSINYKPINPIVFPEPIAPHIAAKKHNFDLSVASISASINLEQFQQNYLLIEGAGGYFVPLNDEQTLADFAVEKELSVILVVGLKLGCINHALLTQQAILSAGLTLKGWVANHIDPNMLVQNENIDTLKVMLKCPLLAEIPYIEHKQAGDKLTDIAASYVKLERLS